MHGIPKDIPLDYSQITENLYIGAWPTKYHREKIISLGVTFIIATILERTDKELNQPPLTLVHTRATDLGSRLIYPTGQILKGVEPAVAAIHNGHKVMVFCKAGKHRSATMTACVLVGLGHSADEAIKIVEAGREEAEIKETHRKTIYKFEQTWRKRNAQD
jgi:protein-tyrosine phosphatase